MLFFALKQTIRPDCDTRDAAQRRGFRKSFSDEFGEFSEGRFMQALGNAGLTRKIISNRWIQPCGVKSCCLLLVPGLFSPKALQGP